MTVNSCGSADAHNLGHDTGETMSPSVAGQCALPGAQNPVTLLSSAPIEQLTANTTGQLTDEEAIVNDRRSDTRARSLASGASRRQLLKGIVGLGAILGGGAVSGTDADAKRPEEPPCSAWWCHVRRQCRGRGERCSRNDQCCSNRCRIVIADPKIYACD